MSLSNRDRIDRALEILKEPLAAYALSQFSTRWGKNWQLPLKQEIGENLKNNEIFSWDAQYLLKIINIGPVWGKGFRHPLNWVAMPTWAPEFWDCRGSRNMGTLSGSFPW